LWSYVVTHEPDYFGKHGFTSPKSLKHKENIINIKKLDELSTRISTEKKRKLHIDLTSLGYTKLLGTGKTSKALIVNVASCSKSADEKIKSAGGQVITAAQESGA
ncbi:uL15 family ribosomal protein, partial [Candidatus Bathyarchaeota archaeon]|nr:uL15 family ribosomal protein [Candidatus Bathyarchaeota archaeon]